MTQHSKDHASNAAHLLAQVEASNRSSLPCAVTLGERHELRHVNQALAKFFGRSPQQLEARPFASLTLEPERAAALFGRALQTGVIESAADLVYAGDAGVTMFAATLVQRVEGLGPQATVVHLVDTTLVTRTRGALMLANEQLVIGSLRERDLADVATQATLELEQQLRRQSLLAGANALLSASLDLATTLHAAAALAVPELAECGIVRLFATGATPRIGVAHLDAESERELAQRQLELANDPDLAALEAGVLQTRAPYRLRGLVQGTHAYTSRDRPARYVLRELGARSGLAVPIMARGTILGVLSLVSVGDRDFEPADMELALELGARAGRALDNAQLFHEAQQASRMREDVLAIVSHDLRSPLGAITMTVQHLLRSCSAYEPPQARKALELIRRSSEHMRRLIEELLEVANIQGGRLVLQCAPARLQALVGRALEMLEEVALQKDVQLIYQAAQEDEAHVCDADRVVRVITNLLSNAIKFTPRGGSVHVMASAREEDVRIVVRDTGPGIAKEEQPRLFEQYWKGDQSGRTGMGLGLYIARGIVEAHGGQIWVESEPPQGSSFFFTLPRGRAPGRGTAN